VGIVSIGRFSDLQPFIMDSGIQAKPEFSEKQIVFYYSFCNIFFALSILRNHSGGRLVIY
jgi:hypothetical protein